MDEWRIVKDRTRCTRPGCLLFASPEYWAVLELPACVRRDVCTPCFREIEVAAREPVLFWRGCRKSEGKGPALDVQSLRQLFDRLGEPRADPQQAESARGLRYLVALLLLRKRVLKMVDASTAAHEAADLVVIDPKVEGMDPVALCAPEMSDERLAVLKQQLLAVLDD